jgi:formate hydrogenlyase subunit 3/multisubunit Na+/H+ antiporter MnhD subunit
MACSNHMAVWPADHMLQPVADTSVGFAADQLHGLQQIIVAVLAIASASYTLNAMHGRSLCFLMAHYD